MPKQMWLSYKYLLNAEKDDIHMKILSTDGNESYTFEYKLAVKKPNAPERAERGIAYKIN